MALDERARFADWQHARTHSLRFKSLAASVATTRVSQNAALSSYASTLSSQRVNPSTLERGFDREPGRCEDYMERNDSKHTYRIVLAEDTVGCARIIELEATSALGAMFLAHMTCSDRVMELYEDEQPLGRLHVTQNGIWTVLSTGCDAELGSAAWKAQR
jgi:hypothetical protein